MIRRRHTNWIGSPDPRQKIVRSIEMMRTHLNRPLRMSQLAAMANISAAHFTESFKAHIVYSLKDYLTRLKTHKDSQLLDHSNLTVKKIANLVGEEDPQHFSGVFKRINELSPTDQRKRDQG
jgi:transcriptional regulator GlxA family with amidase domain